MELRTVHYLKRHRGLRDLLIDYVIYYYYRKAKKIICKCD